MGYTNLFSFWGVNVCIIFTNPAYFIMTSVATIWTHPFWKYANNWWNFFSSGQKNKIIFKHLKFSTGLKECKNIIGKCKNWYWRKQNVGRKTHGKSNQRRKSDAEQTQRHKDATQERKETISDQQEQITQKPIQMLSTPSAASHGPDHYLNLHFNG